MNLRSYIIAYSMVFFWSCDSEEKFDYSNCQESVNYHYWEHPWHSNNETNNASIHEFSDTTDCLYDSCLVYSGLSHNFVCDDNIDTCYWQRDYRFSYRGTVIRLDDNGNKQIIICQLNSKKSLTYDLEYSMINSEGSSIDPKAMIDTNSSPLSRSVFKRWWPLPREPWKEGESVLADSMYWR